jgi:hypothetical protein
MSEPPRRGFWEAPVPPAWAVRALAKGIIGPERFEALVAYTADPNAVRRRFRRRSPCSCRARVRRGCTSWRFEHLG